MFNRIIGKKYQQMFQLKYIKQFTYPILYGSESWIILNKHIRRVEPQIKYLRGIVH